MPEQSPRHLILTLFGLYARDAENWLSVRSLIALMADLEVDAAATRSSVSRLKIEPARVRRIRCRFSGMVLMPSRLEVRSNGTDFETRGPGGEVVIGRGRIDHG